MARNVWILSVTAVMLTGWNVGLADVTSSVILDRLDTLEKQGQEQRTELGELRHVVETQNQKLTEQELVIQELLEWKRNHEAVNPVRQADASNNPLTQTIQGPARVSKRRYNQIHSQRKEPSRVGRLVYDGESPVAFHAVLVVNTIDSNAPGATFGSPKAILFDTVKLNLGGGFNMHTGLFIAPTPGVYLFSLSILTNVHAGRPEDWTDAAILKNSERLAGAFGHGAPHDQGSVTVVVQLNTADQVWAGHLDSNPVFGNYYTSFTGCLLYSTA